MFLRSQSLSRCFLRGSPGLVLMLTKHTPHEPGREKKRSHQAMLAGFCPTTQYQSGVILILLPTHLAMAFLAPRTQRGVSRRRTGFHELLENKKCP